MRSGQCISTVGAHSDPVTSTQFSPLHGNQIVSSSLDGLIRFWDCRFLFKCYKTLYQVKTSNNFVNDRVSVSNVMFTKNERYILSSTLDHKISLWNVHPPHVEDIKKSTDISLPSYTSSSTATTVIQDEQDCHNSTVIKTFTGHQNDKFCVSSCMMELSGSLKSDIMEGSGREIPKIEEDDKLQMKQGNDGKGQYLLSGSENNKIYVWDLQSGVVVNELEAHNDVVLSVCPHPSEQVFASCGSSEDKGIRIWENIL